MIPLLLGRRPVLRRSFDSLRSQAFIDQDLRIGTHSYGLPQKASRVALVEGSHDLLATWRVSEQRIDKRGKGKSNLSDLHDVDGDA